MLKKYLYIQKSLGIYIFYKVVIDANLLSYHKFLNYLGKMAPCRKLEIFTFEIIIKEYKILFFFTKFEKIQ